jgi:hypothetical protein
MTDYGSQGHTRPNNVVDLMSCKDHTSYYTALSRGSTASGTVIMQGYNFNKITGGASGYLRQEFRELELLAEITRINHEGKMLRVLQGITRNNLIREYQLWKGVNHVPKHVHRALKWNKEDPFNLLDNVEDAKWEVIVGKRTAADRIEGNEHTGDIRPTKKRKILEPGYVAAKGSQVLQTLSNDKGKREQVKKPKKVGPLKRKRKEVDTNVPNKKRKTNSGNVPMHLNDTPNVTADSPLGLQWDNRWWSCGYNAVFVVLYAIWLVSTDLSKLKKAINNVQWNTMMSNFPDMKAGTMSFETLRNKIRDSLHAADPISFPTGMKGIYVHTLCDHMLKDNEGSAEQHWVCHDCNMP